MNLPIFCNPFSRFIRQFTNIAPNLQNCKYTCFRHLRICAICDSSGAPIPAICQYCIKIARIRVLRLYNLCNLRHLHGVNHRNLSILHQIGKIASIRVLKTLEFGHFAIVPALKPRNLPHYCINLAKPCKNGVTMRANAYLANCVRVVAAGRSACSDKSNLGGRRSVG